MIQRLHEGLGMAEEAHKGQFSLTWKALRSVPFYLSTMLIILSLTSRLLLLRFLQSITTGLVGKKGAFLSLRFSFTLVVESATESTLGSCHTLRCIKGCFMLEMQWTTRTSLENSIRVMKCNYRLRLGWSKIKNRRLMFLPIIICCCVHSSSFFSSYCTSI